MSLAVAFSLALYATSCVLSDSWVPMTGFLPALASLLCAFMFSRSNDIDSGIFRDTWLFTMIGFQASMCAVPTLLFHFDKIQALAYGIQIIGSLCASFGFAAYVASVPESLSSV